MIWNQEAILELRRLWSEGHSTAEIGRRMGISKNTVVGKAGRLELDARPSPIRRRADPTPSCPRASRSTLPPLANIPARPAIAITPHAPVAVAPSAPVKAEPNSCCCWPIGEPRTKTFRFCDGTSIPGKPYCEEHSKRAYVRGRMDFAA